MNKKGGEKVIAVYWFAILFIIAAAVVYMAAIFYGAPYDIRELETTLLSDKVADCLVNGGYLDQDIFNENFQNNFLELCGVSFKTEDSYEWNLRGQYYLELDIYNFSTYNEGASYIESISDGNAELKEFCNFDLNEKNFPVCLEKDLYVLDKENNQYIIKIISVVNKFEKNV
jgi:hypothetical protein